VNHPDCIVIGTGAVGSAVLYHLARRGAKALGIDRFPPGNDRGSSHGSTRVIRLVYMEHPDYVPLLRRSYELWAELGERVGRRLYHETGLFYAAPAGGEVIPALLECARQHDLSLETLPHAEGQRRFPAFQISEDMTALFEQTAGYLEAEPCVLAHADQARALGAEFLIGETVLDWSADSSGVTVKTDRGDYQAGSLIIAPGAWAGNLLRGVGVDFELRRKELFWFDTPAEMYREKGGCPVFLFETADGVFYGFPDTGEDGLKVAEHTGGGPVADPLQLDRSPRREDRRRVESFMEEHLPGLPRHLRRHAVCMYTMTRDEHSVVDRHPGHDKVFFAAGLSGHGFKLTSVLGEVLAELAIDGGTESTIGFLRLDRPGIT
jgi:sarcosine oxidase